MTTVEATESATDRFAGLSVNVAGVGRVELTQLIARNNETAVYATSRRDLLIKTFDLECGKVDEVSYGPYLSFQLEVENFEDIQSIEELRSRVPTYYGSHLDGERKFAFVAMEY